MPARGGTSAMTGGRVAVNIAALLADRGEAITDLAVLRWEPGAVRTGSVGRDRVAPARQHRRRRRPGRDPDRSGSGAGISVGVVDRDPQWSACRDGGRPSSARAGPGPRRIHRGHPFREGTGHTHMEENVRVSADVLLAWTPVAVLQRRTRPTNLNTTGITQQDQTTRE